MVRARTGIFQLIKTEKFLFFAVTLMRLFALFSEIVVPVLIGVIIDFILRTIENGGEDQVKLLYFVMLIILAAFANYVFSNLYLLFLHMFKAKLSMILRADVFEVLQKQSFKYYDNVNVNTGEIVARSTSDIREMESGYMMPGEIFILTSQVLIIFSILFVIDMYIALIGLLAIPIIWWFQKSHSQKFTPLYIDSRRFYGFHGIVRAYDEIT